ncbi:DgyrCDS3449 [Dimorphilus gyrociliatus]|nr:DgyrCDS3449 [Dimorphilus gyrociliatus]
MKKTNPQVMNDHTENKSKQATIQADSRATMVPNDLDISESEDESSEEREDFNIENIQPQSLIYEPAPKAENFVQCVITRQKLGINGSLHPTYYLHLEKDNSKKGFLLAARKKNATKGNYVISNDETNIAVNGSGYIGKLKSDLLGRHFTMHQRNVGNADKEVIAVAYEHNAFGLKGPKKMNVLIPEQGFQYNLIDRLKDSKLYNMMLLKNKTPSWNDEINSYQLNFNGRVKRASVKNFQIVHMHDDDIVLQFGKVDEEVFIMDYKYPFSALQAFVVSLSSLDH